MKIKLLFTGDFCSKNPYDIKMSDTLIEIINSSDIKCLNFEMALAVGELKSPNGTKLVQSNVSPNWVEDNGFNIISLANNHMLDYGEDGLLATKNAFKTASTIGAGKWDEAYEVNFVDVNGIKIGFFAGTSRDFSSLKDNWTDKHKVGCAWINNNRVNNIVSLAKQKCDYLIVLSHGGIEFMDVPLPEWRDRYRELIDMGADAVIGSHPHVPQGVEKYKGKPIFYSLGNFFFDNNSSKKPLFWDNGILAVLEIDNDIINYQSIPIVKQGDYLDIDVTKETEEHLKYISEILTDDNKYIEKVNSEVLRLYDKYMGWLLSSLNTIELRLNKKNIIQILKTILFVKRNEKVTLHQIREESTSWLLARALKLKSKADL